MEAAHLHSFFQLPVADPLLSWFSDLPAGPCHQLCDPLTMKSCLQEHPGWIEKSQRNQVIRALTWSRIFRFDCSSLSCYALFAIRSIEIALVKEFLCLCEVIWKGEPILGWEGGVSMGLCRLQCEYQDCGKFIRTKPHRALPGPWGAMFVALPPALPFETQQSKQIDTTETWDTQKTAQDTKEPQPGVLDPGVSWGHNGARGGICAG